ncbi:hypothetical protein [Kitasatospora sp. NPDC088783]|uniref:hypothetical protein n=1 Tax=Kitasatospora sp. NPDC088783 TaxID=3364077 RepID=UPI00382B5E4C
MRPTRFPRRADVLATAARALTAPATVTATTASAGVGRTCADAPAHNPPGQQRVRAQLRRRGRVRAERVRRVDPRPRHPGPRRRLPRDGYAAPVAATLVAATPHTPYTPARLCGGGYLDTIWTSG